MRDIGSLCDGISRFAEVYEEKEFDRRVSEEKAKFEALCEDSHDKIVMIQLTRALQMIFEASGIVPSAPATIIVEKSGREKCLEALLRGCKTSKEVCERLHPQMNQYSKEEKRRAMKATSMLLLRLSNSKLARVCRNGRTLTYQITGRGVDRLFHYPKEREKIEKERMERARAQELGARTGEIVNLNEETVESAKRMLGNTDEALKSLGEDQDQARHIHSAYGGLVESLSRVIVVLQRALNANNDAQRVDALDQSTKVLKSVGDLEASFSGALILAREERKPLLDKIRRLGVEMEHLDKKAQERLEKQEKDRKRKKLFNALFVVRSLQQFAGQQPRTIDKGTESLPTQPTPLWTVLKKPPEPSALAAKREKKEDEHLG